MTVTEHCTVCEIALADDTFSVGVQKVTQGPGVKYYQNTNVLVPVCSACKAKELGSVREGAKIALIVWGLLIAIGAVSAGWGGAGLGFGLGFFITLGMNAFKKQSKLVEHPAVKVYTNAGWSVTYP